MQALTQHRALPIHSLGQRRGQSDLARFALDLTWARAEPESAPPSGEYPSPPMSGSPPLPPKASQEAGDRSQGTYQTAGQDVYRGTSTTQPDPRLQTGVSAPVRPYSSEAPERMPYAFARPAEEPIPRHMAYPPPHGQIMHQHPYLPAPGPALGPPPTGYPVPTRPPVPENPATYPTSPKSQRKTKGHVASACVPCKRAHLRCDAQRPCSRCLSNGKEDACVDVQHKKRGRPRLRDDREARYGPSQFGHSHPQDPTARRPLSLYNPQTQMPSEYDESIRRTQSYRVLKSHPPGSAGPRYIERGSAADANIFPAPLSISTRPPEPAAFLTMDMEIAKVSTTFADAVGRASLNGLKLADLLVPGDREKIIVHQRQMQDEQTRKDPNYLPPIFGKQEEERVIQGLGFSAEELARYPLERQEYLTFNMQDGQHRTFPVRLGLAKQDSIYFIVVLLNNAVRSFQHPTPSPHGRDPRDLPYAFQPPQQHTYSQPTPVSATFDPGRPRIGGDTGYGSRQPSTPVQLMPGLSPGLSSSYAASPSRPDYAVGPSSYQVPRSELPPTTRPLQTPGYQLPPIRSRQQQQQQQPPPQQQQLGGPPPEQSWPRDDRQRVDIGGLIEKPDSSKPPPH